MDERFDGIRAKLARAAELIQLLEADYSAYLDAQPYSAQHTAQPDASRYITRLIINEPVPPRLSVLFGEIVHHARSALDHLTCRLLEARNRPVTRASHFPAMLSEEQWQSRVHSPTNAAGEPKCGPLAGFDRSGAAWAFIYEEQPLHAPEPILHPLAQLNELWNEDKHRNITVANSYVEPEAVLSAFTWTPADRPALQERIPVRPLRPIRSGDVLAVFTFAPGELPTDFALSGPLNFEVAFGDSDGRPRPNLIDTVNHVVGIVNRAEPLLERD